MSRSPRIPVSSYQLQRMLNAAFRALDMADCKVDGWGHAGVHFSCGDDTTLALAKPIVMAWAAITLTHRDGAVDASAVRRFLGRVVLLHPTLQDETRMTLAVLLGSRWASVPSLKDF